MELWTGLALGFLGSVHCLGMCGPLAVALPGGDRTKPALVISRVAYNLGRAVTYTALGVLIGAVGEGLAFAGLQRWLSIGAGVTLLLALVAPSRLTRKVTPTLVYLKIQTSLQSLWQRLSARSGVAGLFSIGLLNGLLPCGFVYLALAGATAAGSIIGAASFMLGFGLGTVPAMLAVSLAGGLLHAPIRKKLTRVLPIAGVALATLLILRGLSLGIPYISPNLAGAQTVTEAELCH